MEQAESMAMDTVFAPQSGCPIKPVTNLVFLPDCTGTSCTLWWRSCAHLGTQRLLPLCEAGGRGGPCSMHDLLTAIIVA